MEKRLTMFLACLFLSVGMAMAQKKVTGTVISQEDGLPIIGATVMVQGTKTGTTTNIDGQFSLSVPDGKKIQVSYVGMISQTLKPKPGMKIVMATNATTVKEVVVTGMQKMDKRLFTGATTKIDADKAKLDGVADVSRALEGRAAGVSVQNVSGTFGTAPKIRVRGATSIYGSSTPLWVVDGVVMEDAVDVSADDLSSGDATTLISNAIAGLNPDDIESFQVLKDGSATSIYGARAMAGVVVITTKRGKAGASSINYTGEFTYRLKPNYSEYNISNSQEQMGIYSEMASKGWLEFAQLANSSSQGLYGRMYTLMAQYDKTNGQFGLPYTEEAMNSYLQQAEFRNTDWFDLLFNNNIMQSHSVSVSTGSDKASMYASLSALIDPGWSKSSDVNRYTANMNATFNLSKQVKLTLLTNASFRDQTSPGTLNRSTDVVSGAVSRSFDINPYSFALNTSRTLDPNQTYLRNYAPFNIFSELDNNYIESTQSDLKFQAELNYKPIQGLEIHGLGSMRFVKSAQEHFVLNNSNQAEAYRAGVDDPNIMFYNPYLYTDPDESNSLPQCVMPTGGINMLSNYDTRQYDLRFDAQYNKVWNEGIHIMNLFGGMESSYIDRITEQHDTYGVDYDNGMIVDVTPAFYKQLKEEGGALNAYGKSFYRSLAYFFMGSYSYKGRYSATGTFRYEGTNGLGKATSSRWLPTWNISAAWNVHEEPFFKKFMEKTNQAMSYLKLRASYSMTGDRPAVMNALPIYVADYPWRPSSDQSESSVALSSIANKDLTYEKKHEFNFGVDAGFLNNRINLELDVYWRNNFDLIGEIQTQGAGGVITKYANVADMKSNGIEATLSTRNIQTKDFAWNTDLTFSYCKTEISRLDSRPTVMDLITGSGFARENYPVRALFSIPFVGLNDQGVPQIINEDGEVTTTDINFQEYNKLDFLKYEGATDPTTTGGLNNELRYKNWRLNVFVTYSFGNKIRLDPYFSASYTDQDAMPKEFKNRWAVPGDEKYTTIPTILSTRQYIDNPYLAYAYNAYNYSTERVADGGFIRLKNVSLTYDFAPQFCAKLGLNKISLKLDATNLCLLYADSKLNGQDPEFVNSGGVATPMPKQFTFTVRLGI